MANTQLFASAQARHAAQAMSSNHAGGVAYAMTPAQHLAQLASTGCLNNTFYASAQTQLDEVMKLAQVVDPVFVAKTALYARQAGHMKDMPAILAAALAQRNVELLAKIFDRVIDSGKMLRNFVQIIRSGVVGRRSLGTRPKKLVQHWLLNATEQQLLSAAVGNDPSLADVVKMVHPKPQEAWRAAWFAWLIGRPYKFEDLPPITQALERFKQNHHEAVPDVPFQFLTALDLDTAAWAQIAKNGSWQMVRQNLNTFARHGVFKDKEMTQQVVRKLADQHAVAKARALPYQLLAAYDAAGDDVPHPVREALQDAMEHAISNVPVVEGRVVVCPDVSGSMSSAVTGYRKGATSKVRCIDVAALVAAAMMRKNQDALVLPFEQDVVQVKLNARDTVMTNAAKLAAIGGGGTACSAPIKWLNQRQEQADLVIIVSDNESWADCYHQSKSGRDTPLMAQWDKFKKTNPKAKLVCLDLQPYYSLQAQDRADVLNIGGFSDAVFKLIALFAAGQLGANHWVGVIDEMVV